MLGPLPARYNRVMDASVLERILCMSRGCVILIGMGFLGLLLAGCGGTSKPAAGERSFREQIAQAKQETDTELRARQLIKIGYQQGKAKDSAGADDTLRTARADCDSIADPAAKAGALALLAKAHHELGDGAAAKRAVDAAMEAAGKVKGSEDKAQSLARVASVQAAADSTAAALATLKSAESIAGKIDDPQGKTLSLCAIASAYHKIDKPAERNRMFGVVLDTAKASGDARKRSLAQAEVAAAQSESDEQTAAKTFDVALESAGKIDDPCSRAYALGDIAKKLSEAGFRAKAHDVLNRAERVATKVPQADMQGQALQYVRSLMGKLPKPE
jgi:hypothetical protein